ncbi:MAG: hypothetical protein IJJ85_05250 [Clostridia bacterium]|nr:hypothetical protein [Clostridia bacterium]
MHNTPYTAELMQAYPKEAEALFTDVLKSLDGTAAGAGFDRLLDAYMQTQTLSLGDALAAIDALAETMGISPYTLDFVFIMKCTEIVKARYAAAGIDEKNFWQSADDLRCKLLECIECKGVPGTFVAGWNDGFLKMNRFAYGRFQYEVITYDFDFDFVTASGKKITSGDTLINFHIPSSGVPLTDEVRMASYKEAYGHYKHLFPDGQVVFRCSSWLLYPRHKEFLPPQSNILKFLSDFEIICWEEKENFGDIWRVFGRYADLPYDQLPRDTSLRKAYAEWLCAGNKSGSGCGVIVFDGEKIIR